MADVCFFIPVSEIQTECLFIHLRIAEKTMCMR